LLNQDDGVASCARPSDLSCLASMEKPSAFSIDEVIALGFEAYHCDGDGIHWFWHDGVGLCSDPSSGRCTLVCGRRLLPQGPWYPTNWGEQQLEALEAG
jgi:hypothetical protein